jgi:structural hemagglutinin/hemolysin toxin protein RtxA
MYKICFYVPASHVEQVKNAMFQKGAGKIGLYTSCTWQTLGEGQFMPLLGSNAFIGDLNQLEKVTEYKVEMVCDQAHIKDAIAALKASHPYEEPAFHVIQCEDF